MSNVHFFFHFDAPTRSLTRFHGRFSFVCKQILQEIFNAKVFLIFASTNNNNNNNTEIHKLHFARNISKKKYLTTGIQ